MAFTGRTVGSIYNPSQLSKKGLVDRFVVRLKMFKRIYKLISETKMDKPEEHILIIGQRGMGKTTLLLRLAYQIEEDANLNSWMIPIVFNEEMYGLRTLANLWEKLAEYLEDKSDEFGTVLNEMDVLYGEVKDDETYEEKAFRLLTKKLKKGNKKIVLFIDNFQDILPKFSLHEVQRLREVLTTHTDIRIIAASPIIIDQLLDYKYPLYEQMRTYMLKGVNKEETTILLKKLGESYKAEEVNDLIENNKAKIEVIRRITGGVIRTVVLLFEIFVDNKNGETFKDLEIILDRVSPLYKGRTDELPKNQQAIIDAIAFHWDAITTKEIAKKTRLQSKAISAQLANLGQNDWIEVIPTNTKNHLYRLKERFYNIWYLMRFGRKNDGKKVFWLTRFLDEWLGEKGIDDRTNKLIKCMQEDNYDVGGAYYMTEALANSEYLSKDKEHLLLETAKSFLSGKESGLEHELSESRKNIVDKGIEILKSGNEEKAISYLKKSKKFKNISHTIGYCYSKLINYEKAEFFYLKAIEKGHNNALYNLGNMYTKQHRYEEAEDFYLKAIEKGDNSALNNLAILYMKQHRYKEAEKFYLKAIDKGSVSAQYNLADLYKEQNKNKEAETFYLKAIDKGNVFALNNLAILYMKQHRYQEAEKFYLKAIEKGENNALNNLAALYFDQHRYEEAEKFYLKAIKKEDYRAFINLGFLYQEQDKIKKAEKYWLKGIEKGINNCNNSLAWMQYENKLDKAKGLKYAQIAVENDKENIYFIHTLSTIQLWNDLITESWETAQQFLFTEKNYEEFLDDIIEYFTLLLSKEQFELVYEFFQSEKAKDINVKDRLKPIWYVLMHFMRDKYPNEYLKMGPELEETVLEIIESVKNK